MTHFLTRPRRSLSRRSLLSCCPASNPHFNVVSPTYPRAHSPVTVAPHPSVSVTSLTSEPQLHPQHERPLHQQQSVGSNAYPSPPAPMAPTQPPPHMAPPVAAHMNAGASFRPIKSSSFSTSVEQRYQVLRSKYVFFILSEIIRREM